MVAKSEIRLLKVLPGSPIRFELVPVKLSNAPDYCALSYAWGDPRKCVSIHVNGRELLTTANLGHALHLFSPLLRKAGYYIWADAICIDQQNSAERARQVLLIQEIYQRATVINVWLGLSKNPNVKDNLLPFRKLVEVEKLMGVRGGKNRPDLSKQTLYPGTLGSESEEAWKGIFWMLDAPWWRRAWIIQEASTNVPTIFYCGRVGVQRRYFETLYDFFCGLAPIIQDEAMEKILPHLGRVIEARAMRQDYSHSSTPLEVMHMFRSTECSDPRDRVYATYGIVRDSGSSTWTRTMPHYDASVQEVYIAAVDLLIKESRMGRQFNFLGYVSHTTADRDNTFPTWLPDWTTLYEGTPLPKHFCYSLSSLPKRVYNAGCSVFAEISISGAELSVKGYVIDTITHVASSGLSGFLTSAQILTVNPRVYRGEKLFEIFIRSATADVEYQDHGAGVIRRGIDLEQFTQGDLENDTPLATDTELLERIESSIPLQGRCLCVTESGRLGLVPRATRAGDRVCVFLGGSVLYTLRLKGEKHEFVGEAYFHGLMDGQFFCECFPGEMGDAETFVIV
ncbi:hypothetical protein MMC30_000310 [Trapelia coarctata]|nr:hypothetical protein [Trapelia coarctata]